MNLIEADSNQSNESHLINDRVRNTAQKLFGELDNGFTLHFRDTDRFQGNAIFVGISDGTNDYMIGASRAEHKGDKKTAEKLFLEAVKLSKPPEKSQEKVIGEGDTKKGSGIGDL